MGPVKAGLITQRILKDYNPGTVVMLGIAASMSDDVKLGDVVIATQVDAYMEHSKAEGKDEFSFSLGGEAYRSSADLTNFAQNFQFAHGGVFREWERQCSEELLGLFPDREILDPLITRKLIREKAQKITGHIASGPTVGAAVAFIEWLKLKDRKYLALEMEAAGLMAAVAEEITPRRTLILRAISDYGDQRKGELDRTNSGAFRLYAIRNAISLLWAFLDTHALPNPSPVALAVAAVAAGAAELSGGSGSSAQEAGDAKNTELSAEEIKELSLVIEGEGVALEEANSSSNEGGVNVNPATELSQRFLRLPQYKRIRLGQKLGLLFEDEKRLQGFEQARRIFNRAKQEKKLDQLWHEVEEAGGGGGDAGYADGSHNPFSNEEADEEKT